MRNLACFVMGSCLFCLCVTSAPAQKSPRRQVFLHYDYMAGNGISMAPSADQIQAVVDAFAQHDIDLIIDPVHKALPLFEYTYLHDPAFPHTDDEQTCIRLLGAVNFYDLKGQYYRKRRSNEHYAIFVKHELDVDTPFTEIDGNPLCGRNTFSSGVSAGIPAADFLVATERAAEFAQLQPLSVAGTFMHELGHNLGLFHGGDEDLNFKPNYISVMNYAFQLGIHATDSPASTTGIAADCPRFCEGGTGWAGIDNPALRHVDYSAQALPTLDSTALNEGAGLGAAMNFLGGYDFSFISSDPSVSRCFYQTIIPSNGPVDFNCNGIIESSVNAVVNGENQINLVGCAPLGPCSVFHGFDDWAEVRACIDTGCSFANGPHKPAHESFPVGSSPGKVTFQTGTYYLGTVNATVSACGRSLSNGQSATCGRQFQPTANPLTISLGGNTLQWLFTSWSWSGGVSCISTLLNPVSCTNNGTGALAALYAPQENITNFMTLNLDAPPGPANGSIVTASPVTLAGHATFTQSPYSVPVTIYVDDENGRWVVACTVMSDALGNFSCPFTPAIVGRTYHWEAAAAYFPGYYSEAFTNAWAFTYSPPQPPTAPTGLTPGGPQPPAGLPATTVSTLTPTLSWTAAQGATSYTVTLINVATGATVFTWSGSATSVLSPALQNGVSYAWSVTAANAVGSAASATLYFTVNTTCPATGC